jgi:FO synthase
MDSVTGGHLITENASGFHDRGRAPLHALMAEAAGLRDAGHGNLISYSRKVFVPLTRLCRDVCGYCTFAETPRDGVAAYLSADEVLAIARAGAAAGCHEALFTLGDKPELRYPSARRALDALGHDTTISYLAEMCALVLDETGLLPHANAGVMIADELAMLRSVTVSQGLMLESASARLCQKGGPHFGSPDKAPHLRLETIRAAGRLAIPFTTGILIGIGETRTERIESLLALAALHAEFGHIQEIIIQNFRAKPATRMEGAPEPDADELAWTIAMARIVFGAHMNIQAPPNLSPGRVGELIGAGINDWGGVSPVTPDHVNPEYRWPAIEELAAQTGAAGKELVERLAIYPAFALDGGRWLDQGLRTAVLRATDSDGLARADPWSPGTNQAIPVETAHRAAPDPAMSEIVGRAEQGEELSETQIEILFRARGADFTLVCRAADALRRETVGDGIAYVVTRNINYTNICSYGCRFCAFSKGRTSANLRGAPYNLDLGEIGRRVAEAWQRGATEVCLQGGIHPDYTGETYLDICRAVKDAAPDIHVHAFSPLEIHSGAATLGIPVGRYLRMLKGAGLGSLPGTAAEILDDEVRRELCPDKITTDEWLAVVAAAHGEGLATTSTIMFGHMETPGSWARHLLHLRALQTRTGMITEFVPLPFVHMETPIYLKGRARRGPTFREAVLMHAIARLALHPLIPNIQVSWVKLGADGAAACLDAGANDLGGTLMNESISRAAGTVHGEEFPPQAMEALICGLGRTPRQRTTLYRDAPAERRTASFAAPPLAPALAQVAKQA